MSRTIPVPPSVTNATFVWKEVFARTWLPWSRGEPSSFLSSPSCLVIQCWFQVTLGAWHCLIRHNPNLHRNQSSIKLNFPTWDRCFTARLSSSYSSNLLLGSIYMASPWWKRQCCMHGTRQYPKQVHHTNSSSPPTQLLHGWQSHMYPMSPNSLERNQMACCGSHPYQESMLRSVRLPSLSNIFATQAIATNKWRISAHWPSQHTTIPLPTSKSIWFQTFRKNTVVWKKCADVHV